MLFLNDDLDSRKLCAPTPESEACICLIVGCCENQPWLNILSRGKTLKETHWFVKLYLMRDRSHWHFLSHTWILTELWFITGYKWTVQNCLYWWVLKFQDMKRARRMFKLIDCQNLRETSQRMIEESYAPHVAGVDTDARRRRRTRPDHRR